ncbi:hypothetical protein [Ventrimonas faecis]
MKKFHCGLKELVNFIQVDSRTEHLEFQENIPDTLHGYPPS